MIRGQLRFVSGAALVIKVLTSGGTCSLQETVGVDEHDVQIHFSVDAVDRSGAGVLKHVEVVPESRIVVELCQPDLSVADLAEVLHVVGGL